MKNSVIKPIRSFIAGSEWLYYNIYLGPETSDKFLIFTLLPLTQMLIQEGTIDKWFYIRYSDENGSHLRVRFHLCNTKDTGKIILKLYNLVMPYLDERSISDITVNTYKRELERYGFRTIEEFESLFFVNSQLILKLILLAEDSQENRWLYGMKAIDAFLESCGYSLGQKKELLESLKTNFGNEFGIDKEIRKQLSKKYRDNKYKIEAVFNDKNPELDPMIKVFAEESKVYFAIILKKMKVDILDKSVIIEDFLASYIHMHCNRLFKSKQRKNEWVLYDLLYEYYYSKIARFKYSSTKEEQKNLIQI
ncbi:thiopeptide-type bacteriocin biosynthesis protein [Flavobacterium chryseum]|uniref:thiopeptide-type bacteriocin biosynthesis protein n=1 Tax=Flavobacterium sp. P3160 TaxID=2512113 RepID=UPI00105DF8DE|nr:thiopeptide-type bacteriocin biosynthesis protein [Flavobacterium sp. P3160]TDO68935.1 thiopeptide-type bacteriocin biosynthesis protein [Flavobacterium sp. P3160]